MTKGFFVLTLVSALGCATVGGVFFAFSAFVMRALAGLPPAQGIAAMQAVNVAAVRPAFMSAMFATAAACLTLVVRAVLTWGTLPAAVLLAGGVLYLGGAVLLTTVHHVPRNDALAVVDPNGPDAAAHWADYVRRWTAWNHVRAGACIAAATAFTGALAA